MPEAGTGTRPTTGMRGGWKRARRRLGAIDTALYLSLNRLNGGPLVDRLLIFVSRVLDWGELWVLIALLAAWHDHVHLGHLPLVVIPALWATMLTVNFPIKGLFRRKRPFLVHERTRLVGRRPTDTSFPSGHTAAAFAGATLLSPHLPGLAPLLWGFALLVGFSRIYLGVHFPADVLVGGMVGAALATFYGWLTRMVIPGV